MAYLVLLLALGSVMGLPPRNPNEFDTSQVTARPSTTTGSGYCGEPPTIAHSTIDGTAPPYEEGTPLLYICNPGYYTDGSPYSRCLAGEWEGPVMTCQPKSCRDPGYPEHGYRHSTDFTYGARVYYYCNDGYQLIGESYRTCESNQEWTGTLPSCREINDEGTAMTTDEVGSGEIQVEETKPLHENILDILKKGEYDYETIPSKPIDREIVVDGDVKLTENNPPPPAETDYIIYRPPSQPNTDRPVTYPYPKTTTATQAAPIGARIVVHRQRPTTSDFVNPNRVSVATSPPNLYNKKHLQRPSTKDRDTSSGSQPIETDYFPGKEQYGNDYYTKDVVPTSSKIETLDIDDADSLQVDSGREDLDESSGSGSGFSSGEIVDEEIEVGLFTTPPVIEYCGAPPLIENAENDGTGVPYYDGTDVTYTCFEGYVGQGVPTMTCRDGSWTMTTLRAQFKCVVKPCPEPPVPENGYKQGEDYDVGSYIFLNCNEGYELDGEHYRSCLSNQTWSGELPDCRRKLCADPGDVPNGYRQGFVNTYDATVFYFCNEGYELMGSSNLTCRADQSWSAARPICRERSCGSPREIENGYYSGSDFRTGGRVFYYCNDGFHLVGDNYMYCGTDRRWSGEPPSCIAKSCGEPGRIENGYRVGDDFSVGARVNFYCNQGFELVGEHFRTCLIDEEWSDVVPICKEQEELIIDNNTDDPTSIPTAIVGVTDDEDLLTDIGSGTWPSGFGSGFDFVCDETTCKYGGVCFPSAVQYQCVCNFTCENSPAEVTCGSDGHVYGNTCEIRLAACKTQRLITSAPNSVCDELSVEQVLPHCGMETNEPGWSDWSLWIRSGSKDIRFRHCRSDKARPDSRSHCAGHDIQTRLCPKERTNVCQSENGTLGYDYRYKCKGVDGHDLPDSSEVFMGNSSYDDCWFSLYTVKNSRYKYFHWSFSKLMEEGNVQNWCHKRNQFIPFYPAHGYCEMALHYFCHSQSKCWYEDEKEQSKPGDRLDTCWTTFAFGGRPPTVFEEVKSSQIVICQKFSSKSSFGTMFEDTTSHFATLYDTSTRIPVFSMTKVERLSDGGWPVVPYLLERGLVDEGQFISWLFSTPEKGLSSQYELPNKLKEDLCKLGRNQALYDDYKLSGFRVGPLLSPDLSGCHTASKVASFALTNSVPMHLTQYYAWTSAMESVKDYAAKQCGVSVERDHTGVYCQQPEDVKASLFLVSGAVASYDPREVIGNNVNVPAMVWLAGCCVQTDGSRVRSFAFYLMNKIDFPVRKLPVAELETLLTVMSNPNVASELPVKVFPASQGICGNPQNDDTSHLIV